MTKGTAPTDSLSGMKKKLGTPEGWTQLVPDPEIWGGLSLRQRQIFAGICRGETDKEIAQHLGITISTMRNYLRLLSAKAGARNRTDLIVKMFRLLPPVIIGGAMPVVSCVSEEHAA